jgi:uroporphyrin-III C-methyltransferase
VEVELVPGISSALAVPALSGIPVTLRGVAASFAVIAGHRQNQKKQEWARYRDVDTLVVLMGVENRASIAENLITAGRDSAEPVAFIERGSTDRERVVTSTLAKVARGEADVASPAVFVIGQVVSLRRKLKRFLNDSIPAMAMEATHVQC